MRFPYHVALILRSVARGIWEELIVPQRLNEFMSLDFRTWIRKNFSQSAYFPILRDEWVELFGIIIWVLWKHRNQIIFTPEALPRDNVLVWSRRLQSEIRAALALRAVGSVRNFRPAEASPGTADQSGSWVAPGKVWFKLNTDGACRSDSGLAACEGAIRDHTGAWVAGFSKAIGSYSAWEAKL
ncbi:hypothetical protein F3Y22_tig00117048pilonHSYRG01045 [Hibiscus syriacus]|uniref:RNase H type-1 domain-containing protein n=1 Tax=Hibiscus syriacus TaxID=106335 RepID=A0A6A2XL62_HIBSY|nr:hypothetical protein F3Y22_tig00117048pilonHSYRG01045 [Hibiscus syriacus]